MSEEQRQRLMFGQASRDYLRYLTEHPHAPRFNFESSDLLTDTSLGDVRRFASEVLKLAFWEPGELPDWMPGFLDRVFQEIPWYRALGGVPKDFQAIPTSDRALLASEVERLIPDTVPLRDITVYTTSGTSGSKIAIPTDAGVTSKVLVLIDFLLSRFGMSLPRGGGVVAVAAVFYQEETLTYPSLSHYLNGSASLKLNLHPKSWRSPCDPADYLRSLSPSVLTGCPFSLGRLAELCPDLRPSLVVSSAEALLEGFRSQLESVFRCPVIDVYGLTEAKFVAAGFGGEGHDLLSPDLYVEILDEEGSPVPFGEVGEVVLTGGRNKCLPLVRYRTGDFAALGHRGRQPFLTGLQGRAAVVLRDGRGLAMSGLDVVNALKLCPLVGFSFEQLADLSYRLNYCGEVEAAVLSTLLRERLGLCGEVTKSTSWTGKQHLFRNLAIGED